MHKKFAVRPFLFALFLMFGGDFPRYPFGITEKHLIFLVFSWPRLYVVLLGASFIAYLFSERKFPSFPQELKFLAAPTFALILGFLPSVIFSDFRRLGFEAFAGFLAILLFSYLFASLITDEAIHSKIWMTVTAAILFLAVRVVVWRLCEGLDVGAYHIMNNSWLGKLQIAMVLNLFAPFFLMRFLTKRDFLQGLTWILCGVAVFTLFARNGSIVFASTSGLILFQNKGSKKILLLCAMLILLLAPIFFKGLRNAKYMVKTISHFTSDEGFKTRLGIWKETLRMFRDHPVTGIGFGTYDEIAYSEYHTQFDAGYEIKNKFYRGGWSAHNLFLHLLAETGVVGFSAVIYFLISVVLYLIWAWKLNYSIRSDIFALLCFLGAFCVLSLTDNFFSIRVYENLRMNLTFSFLLLYSLLNVLKSTKNSLN